jgi:hypothetical protein
LNHAERNTVRRQQPDVCHHRARFESEPGSVGQMDYWAYVELPIDEVRRRLNIVPKA